MANLFSNPGKWVSERLGIGGTAKTLLSGNIGQGLNEVWNGAGVQPAVATLLGLYALGIDPLIALQTGSLNSAAGMSPLGGVGNLLQSGVLKLGSLAGMPGFGATGSSLGSVAGSVGEGAKGGTGVAGNASGFNWGGKAVPMFIDLYKYMQEQRAQDKQRQQLYDMMTADQKAQQDAIDMMQAAALSEQQMKERELQANIDAQAKYQEYLRMGLDETTAARKAQEGFQERALGVQQDMFNKSLAEQARGADASLRGLYNQAAMQMAGDVMGAQTAYDTQLNLAAAQQRESMPQTMAQRQMLQAVPALMQLMGMPAYQIPMNIEQLDPMSLKRDFLGDYQKTLAGVRPLTDSMMAGGSAPASATGTAAVGSLAQLSPTYNTTAMTPLAGGYNFQASPMFTIQQKLNEDAINRAALARGKGGSSATMAALSSMNQNLSASELEKQYSRLANMANMAMGAAPFSVGSTLQGSLQNPLSSLSTFGANMPNTGDAMNQAARDRSNLYSTFGTNMASTLGNMGTSAMGWGTNLANQLSGMGQNASAWGANLGKLYSGLGESNTANQQALAGMIKNRATTPFKYLSAMTSTKNPVSLADTLGNLWKMWGS